MAKTRSQIALQKLKGMKVNRPTRNDVREFLLWEGYVRRHELREMLLALSVYPGPLMRPPEPVQKYQGAKAYRAYKGIKREKRA